MTELANTLDRALARPSFLSAKNENMAKMRKSRLKEESVDGRDYDRW